MIPLYKIKLNRVISRYDCKMLYNNTTIDKKAKKITTINNPKLFILQTVSWKPKRDVEKDFSGVE